ncbi:MAG: thioredoxin domain-containing protein [Planctomycetota bacterium]|nr:thioredoxin domain-containing protein [Planctomycetota bacterium]
MRCAPWLPWLLVACQGPGQLPLADPPMTSKPETTNRLAHETSPYLLQHASNPVDWYPWGPEALERARREDKPIFLSIGYSACHWCHVMEHESFENPAIAALMNEHFVNIKVDREERPDLDDIYMKSVQAMTGSGGWPMSVFLTPGLEPFFGGTYFPPVRRYGRPSFPEILQSLAAAWKQDRESMLKRGKALGDMIRKDPASAGAGDLDADVLNAAFAMLASNFDAQWGGFGDAPKFPHAMDVRLVLRHWLRTEDPQALAMVTVTLDRMAAGGVYDQLGGGFHRYSTDAKWLIPHFEKMLYDNALLVPAYLEAHLATGNPEYARVARECCDWVLREMVTPEGAFASTQDADSEGEEGKYFAWTPKELEAVLGAKHGRWAAEWFGVTDEGNFEHGKSALWRPDSAAEVAERLRVPQAELEAAMVQARTKLLAARALRVKPATDDKVLASWNGLMVSCLAQASQVLGQESYLAAARRAATYVLANMRTPQGRLLATTRGGRAKLNAYLDDYAFLIAGLIDLYEADFDPHWIEHALALESVVHEHYSDLANGGWFTTSDDHEKLIARLKSPQDGALPSGQSVHALNLLRLAELTGRGPLAQRAETAIRSAGAMINRYPQAFSQMLAAVDFIAAGPREIVIAGELSDPRTRALVAAVRGRFQPQRTVALADSRADTVLMPILDGKGATAAGPRAFVCRNYACRAPVTTPEALLHELVD